MLPYQYEPEATGNTSGGAESSDSESEGDLSHLVFAREYERDLRHQMVYIYSFQIRQEEQKVSNSVILINFIV